MILSIILLILGFFLLTKGADYFVEGASALALKFKIPSIIIGLTIVAMGTSAPEAAISINSALKGIEGIAIGNIIGSNIANIFLILGISSLIYNLTLQKNTIKFEMPFVFFITLLLGFYGFFFGEISRLAALSFIVLFVLFLIYLLKIAKNIEELDEDAKNLGIFKIILFIFGGLLALFYGSEFTINSAVDIAHALNISDRIIGLTIVAFGTSLPELVVCINAALKKESDLCIGNIIGSNIFNILFVLGLAGIIHPITYKANFLSDNILALIAVLMLFIYTFKSKQLNKWQGLSFVLIYLGYVVYLVVR